MRGIVFKHSSLVSGIEIRDSIGSRTVNHKLSCVAEVALDDRKIVCATRLGPLDIPRSSAHKAKDFVNFCTVQSFCLS